MKKFIALTALAIVTLSAIIANATPGVSFDVTLNPAGDFTGKISDVVGSAQKSGDKIIAENIKVPLKNLSTGIGLRDSHTKKYLEVEKHPEVILVKGEGKDGKGNGILKVKGIEKPFNFTYKVEGNELEADFPIKLSDYKIEDISYKGIGVEDVVQVKARVPLSQAQATQAPKAAAPAAKAKKK